MQLFRRSGMPMDDCQLQRCMAVAVFLLDDGASRDQSLACSG